MTKKTNWSIFLIFLGLAFQPLFAQEKPLKNLIEDKRDRKYAFYPSTLRMINISQDPDYNELVSGIDKLLIYTLDSATKADKSYREIVPTYSDMGFEEYASAFGGEMTLSILGKEGSENEFVGYFGQNEMVIAFYMKGVVNWQKIPTLLNTLKEGDLLNLFELKQ